MVFLWSLYLHVLSIKKCITVWTSQKWLCQLKSSRMISYIDVRNYEYNDIYISMLFYTFILLLNALFSWFKNVNFNFSTCSYLKQFRQRKLVYFKVFFGVDIAWIISWSIKTIKKIWEHELHGLARADPRLRSSNHGDLIVY